MKHSFSSPKRCQYFKSLQITLSAIGLAAVLVGSAERGQAAGALWISAPNWSYSAAVASSPIGTAYFYGFSVGAGTWSYAGAFSVDPGVGSAYAFATATAGRGGMGAFQWAGVADPYGGVGVDTPFVDPSNGSAFPTNDPTSDPTSDPTTSAYTISNTGITLTGTGSELSGLDGLQAFVYNGPTDLASLESALGATAENGNTSAGDVTDTSALMGDLGLTPLDAPDNDLSSLSSLNFTENTGLIASDFSNVILVGEASTPEPGTLTLMAAGLTAAGWCFRKRNRV